MFKLLDFVRQSDSDIVHLDIYACVALKCGVGIVFCSSSIKFTMLPNSLRLTRCQHNDHLRKKENPKTLKALHFA